MRGEGSKKRKSPGKKQKVKLSGGKGRNAKHNAERGGSKKKTPNKLVGGAKAEFAGERESALKKYCGFEKTGRKGNAWEGLSRLKLQKGAE